MQLANIVLADALATPVNHTFVPTGPDKTGTHWLVDYSQQNAVGYWRISVQTKQPDAPKPGESSANRTYRVAIGLHEPVLETNGDSSLTGILPAPTVAYIPRVITEYIVSERATIQQRADLVKMNGNLQLNSQVVSLVKDLFTIN